MVVAACTLAELGVPLAGDLIVNTVTEEESTGAGGLFAARLLQADAAIVPEPSGLAVWVACRGSLLPRITVRGRAGHAGIAPLPPEQGGAVNAIEKMTIVLDGGRAPARALGAAAAASVPLGRRLRADDHRGRRVARLLPGLVHARVPHRVPARPRRRRAATASHVEREFEQWIAEAAAARPLAARASARDRLGRRRRAARPRSPTDDPDRAGARRGRPRPRPARPTSAASTTGTTARRSRSRPASPPSASARATSTARTRSTSTCRSTTSWPAPSASRSRRCASAAERGRGRAPGVRPAVLARASRESAGACEASLPRDFATSTTHDADRDPDQREPPDLVEPVERRRLVDDAVERGDARRPPTMPATTRPARFSPGCPLKPVSAISR